MILLYIIIAIILILLIAYISINNKLNRIQVKIDESESGIDVALTKRYDVLTKQLDIVKAYAKHETETFEKVIEMRSGLPINEKKQLASQMSDLQNRINVVAEAYPELRSSENFKNLQITVNDTEEHLQAARRAYNANVSTYNQMLVTFPDSVIAGMRNLQRRPFFEAEETKRADIKMEF